MYFQNLYKKEGKCYLFKLGQYFHRRYGKILGNEYRQEKVYIVSTDHDRAIMSAQANLAGLYEPTDTEKWHQDILWVLIHNSFLFF